MFLLLEKRTAQVLAERFTFMPKVLPRILRGGIYTVKVGDHYR